MNTPSIADLKAAWTPRDYSTHKLRRVGVDLLANGESVTAALLAEVAGVSVDEATSHIAEARQAGVEVEDGAIVGSALTLRPTAHRFRVRGNDMYTWCGFDALFLPIIVGERAAVASTCPVTRRRSG
jgi:alkylmercury lyase